MSIDANIEVEEGFEWEVDSRRIVEVEDRVEVVL
jgi:hypothetical protein